jgi:hypothetical protein
MGKGYVLRVEGPNPCSSWVTQGTFPLHNFPLYNALSPTVHFNGSNGTAYTRPSKVQNKRYCKCFIRTCPREMEIGDRDMLIFSGKLRKVDRDQETGHLEKE